MKRDWEIIRKAMLMLEESGPDANIGGLQVAPDDPESAGYSLYQAVKGGLAEGVVFEPNMGAPSAVLTGITWEGHNFIESIRQDAVWASVKKTASDKGLDLTVNIIGRLAGSIMEKMLGLHS
jgi:hypothetical protein